MNSKNIYLYRHIIWYKPNASFKSKGAYYKGYYFPRRIAPQFNMEHILIFYKNFSNKIASTKCKLRYNEPLDKINKEFYKIFSSSVWDIHALSPSRNKYNHPASFPESIPFRLIKLFTFKDEFILDPFMGKGTSLKMALALGRNAIGYEINENYINMFSNSYLYDDIKCPDYCKSNYLEYLKDKKRNIFNPDDIKIDIIDKLKKNY